MLPFIAALPGFVVRVAAHEATRRALATAVAGVIVGAFSEAVWPKPRT